MVTTGCRLIPGHGTVPTVVTRTVAAGGLGVVIRINQIVRKQRGAGCYSMVPMSVYVSWVK